MVDRGESEGNKLTPPQATHGSDARLYAREANLPEARTYSFLNVLLFSLQEHISFPALDEDYIASFAVYKENMKRRRLTLVWVQYLSVHSRDRMCRSQMMISSKSFQKMENTLFVYHAANIHCKSHAR